MGLKNLDLLKKGNWLNKIQAQPFSYSFVP